jgi:hypothetical protein
MIKNICWSSYKVPIILVLFEWNLNFVEILKKTKQMSNFMKIHLVGAEFFHADRRTDRRGEANSRFLQFG